MKQTTAKDVRYYCPACRQTMVRKVFRASATRRSYCERTGKVTIMRKRKQA